MKEIIKKGQMRIWHIPQVGCDVPTFYVNVESLKEGAKLLDTIWDYDLFQYENKIKPDYCKLFRTSSI